MKKLIIVAFVAAITTIAGYNIYSSQANEKLSNLMLANIEALANNGESGADPNTAYGYKLINCKKNGAIIGARCSLNQPSDECKYNNEWGSCK